jgi:hypothetical protein
MNLRLSTLKAASFYLLHNVSTLTQCRKLSCDIFVCKHFASYQGYPNYRWDLILYTKVNVLSYLKCTATSRMLCTYISALNQMRKTQWLSTRNEEFAEVLLNIPTVAKFKSLFVWEFLKAKCLHNCAKKWRISDRCVFFMSCQYDITATEMPVTHSYGAVWDHVERSQTSCGRNSLCRPHPGIMTDKVSG